MHRKYMYPYIQVNVAKRKHGKSHVSEIFLVKIQENILRKSLHQTLMLHPTVAKNSFLSFSFAAAK